LIATPLVIHFVLSIVSHRPHQRFELIAMPLVNGQLPKLVDGKPARLQPLRELRHAGERQFNDGTTVAWVSIRTSISASQWGQVTIIVPKAIEKHSSVAAFPCRSPETKIRSERTWTVQ
jgi:hypothetical protein